MKIRKLLFGLTASLLIGLYPAIPVQAGDQGTETRSSITVDGKQRDYILYTPEATGKLPLIIALHGGQGNGAKFASQTGFNAIADTNGFAVVYPNSVKYWNDGRATTENGPDDVGFISALIDQLVKNHNIDPKRVYATGISNGGMFTLRLACELNDKIAAFAPVAASFPVPYAPRCKPGRAVPVLMANGTADEFIKWDGGDIRKGRNRGAGGTTIPVSETLAFWVNNNRCSEKASSTELPDKDADDDTRVQRIEYNGCNQDASVQQFKIIGGGHTWPGNPNHAGFFKRRLVGPVSREIKQTESAWRFFQQYQL